MVFVERRFDLGDQEVAARFHVPVLAPGGECQCPGGEYQCRCQIKWPSRQQERYASGIDGLQALMLAMRVVHNTLMESEEYLAGTLTYLGQDDLDLPPAWGAGPLYQAGTKPQ